MTRFTREELRELAPMHALGATTPEEAAAMEAAMETDHELAAEVASFRDVPAMLATAAPVTPAPAVREALLAAVAAPLRLEPAPVSAWRRAMPMLAAASLVVAALAGLASVRTQREAEALRTTNLALSSELARRERTLNTMLEGERDLHLVQVGAAAGERGPGIQFFWNARQGRGVAHVFRLAPAPAGRDYQLWALVNGRPVSLVVFDSDADGHALVDVEGLATSVAGVTDILVSVEPEGGSPQPTTTPFLGGKFPGA